MDTITKCAEHKVGTDFSLWYDEYTKWWHARKRLDLVNEIHTPFLIDSGKNPTEACEKLLSSLDNYNDERLAGGTKSGGFI